MNNRRKIDWTPSRKSRFVLDLLCRANSRLVQTMSEALHDPIHTNLAAGSGKDHVQQNLTFKIELESLGRIRRLWLRQDDHRLDRRRLFDSLLFRRFGNLLVLIGKTCGLHRAAAASAAGRRDGYAV